MSGASSYGGRGTGGPWPTSPPFVLCFLTPRPPWQPPAGEYSCWRSPFIPLHGTLSPHRYLGSSAREVNGTCGVTAVKSVVSVSLVCFVRTNFFFFCLLYSVISLHPTTIVKWEVIYTFFPSNKCYSCGQNYRGDSFNEKRLVGIVSCPCFLLF